MTAPALSISYNAEDLATQARAAHNLALKNALWAKVAVAAPGIHDIRQWRMGRETIGV